MFQKYKPTWLVEAIYQITPEQLKKHGFAAVLTDLDNTLIAWNNPDGTEELLHWIEGMKNAGIPVLVISNNKRHRVERAVKHLDLDYIPWATKPLTRGFKEAQRRLNLPKEKLLMVGDQLLTDIRGANQAGIASVLVQPIVATDLWNTKINRLMEKRIMDHFRKKYGTAMDWRKELE